MRLWRSLPLGWRMLLVAGVPFGAAMGTMVLVMSGDLGVAGSAGLVSGLGFGLTMALVLGLVQVIVTSRGGSQLATPVETHPTATVRTAAGTADVLRVLRAELDAMGCSDTTVRVDPQGLSATTPTSWRSWGEVVSIEVMAEEGGTSVRVQSRPSVPTTMLDYGKNRANVDRIVAHLRQRFDTQEVVQSAHSAPVARPTVTELPS